MTFKNATFPLRKPPKSYKGSTPTVTFKKDGEGLFLSSGLVDKFNLKTDQFFDVKFDTDKKKIRLYKIKAKELGQTFYVKTAKAGGKTKDGNCRLLIRMKEAFLQLGINPSEPITIIPIITNDGSIITISYKDCINGECISKNSI